MKFILLKHYRYEISDKHSKLQIKNTELETQYFVLIPDLVGN